MCNQIREDELQAEEDRFSESIANDSWLYDDILKNPIIFEEDVADQSTAVSRFGYNPHTEKFMIQWNTGPRRYIYPYVTADEAADFLRNAWEAQPKPSYGKAANIFKRLHESNRLSKIIYDDAAQIIDSLNPKQIDALIVVMRDREILD